MEEEKKRCRWCGELIDKKNIKKHEDTCNLNDGGKYEQDQEDIANKYYN